MSKNQAVFGARFCISKLAKPAKKSKIQGTSKSINNNRQLVSRYNTLHRILLDGSLQVDPQSHQTALKFSVQGV